MTEHVKSVSVQRVIAAPPEKIFDVLADPAQHPVIDGSGTVKSTRGQEPDRLELGTKFGMSMRLGIPYAITNTVVEFDDNRLIAWRHFGGHRWRYELEPVDAGTRVRETYDWSTAILGNRGCAGNVAEPEAKVGQKSVPRGSGRRRRKAPFPGPFEVAGAGFEPATSGL